VLSSSIVRPLRHCAKRLLCIWPQFPRRTLPQSITERLLNPINGCTVGAGHFNQLEVPDQANAMIESFLRHYV
jgi:hypothetical protein